jgi:predicted HicB family RNase H-like nuclease
MNKIVDKYTFRVEWSEEDTVHIAYCLEMPSLKAHGKTPEKALHEVQSVVSDAIAWMKKDGEEIPEPLSLRKYKGNLTLRVPPEVHKKLVIASTEAGVSLNQYLLSKIA